MRGLSSWNGAPESPEGIRDGNGNRGHGGGILLTIVCTAATIDLWKVPWITPSHAMQEVLKYQDGVPGDLPGSTPEARR